MIDDSIMVPVRRPGSGTQPTAEAFDWHAGKITRSTPVTCTYRNTQNVRRFLRAQRGGDFKFDRPFMQWIKGGSAKTMGDVADEWLRRRDASGR
jgi:uncharacterized protein DUF6434